MTGGRMTNGRTTGGRMTTGRMTDGRLRLRRRTFAKALGLGLTAPLAYRIASMAGAAPSPRPVRLFIYYIPHGWPFEHVEPLADGAFLQNSPILAPLAPFADQVRVLRGIDINSVRETHEALPAVLTGSDTGESDSIDILIAQALGVTAHVIGALPYKVTTGFGKDSYLVRHGTWVRANEHPVAVADELFANLGAPSGDGGQVGDDAVFRAQTMSLTERELEELHTRMQSLSAEANKLNLHLEAVRNLKAGGGGTPSILNCDSRPALPAVDAFPQFGEPLESLLMAQVVDGHLEAAATAMVCGSAQVVTMQNMWTNADVTFDFPGGPNIAAQHHDPVSHSQNEPGRSNFALCQRWFYERLAAQMLTTLDQPDPSDTDPSRTVLDNSIIYVCSEVGDGFQHNKATDEVWIDGRTHTGYLPALVIGGGGGYFGPGGQAIDLSRFNTDLLATIAEAMGTPITSMAGKPVQVIEELKA